MSLSYLQSLVGKNVILLSYQRNVFRNKMHKMVENGNEYALHIDMGVADRLMHRITYPGVYFITDVMIRGTEYVVYLKKQIDLKKFSIVTSASTYKYYVSSYNRMQYKLDGGYTFDALEFEIGGFKQLTFNYNSYIIAKEKTPGRKRIAVCLGDKVVVDNVNDITCNFDWFTVE